MKKYEDKSLHRILTFHCTKCDYKLEEMNGWIENVPVVCPECKEGEIEEYSSGCVNFVDIARQKNWKKGLSVSEQANVIANQKLNPY